MPIDFSEFHFLRADLLWLFVPVLFGLYGVRHLSKKRSSWEKVISPHLLKFLMVSAEKQQSVFNFWLTATIACLMVLAASGPSFREKNVPIFKTEDARVILLDLSLSMNATDIKPARIDRAKHKIMDLLQQTKEGTVGLVVYAGDAFIISPLTSDANTIASMIPTLSTSIMPVLGSRPDIAINKAISLLKNAKQTHGQVVWITDGIDREYINPVITEINRENYKISILAVGTEQGAPIPLPQNSGFLKDQSGNIILPKLDVENLQEIATKTNGQYVELSADSRDIQFIVDALAVEKEDQSSLSDQRISRWIDDGYWISWILLILMLGKLFRPSNGHILNFSGSSIAPLSLTLLAISLAIPNQAKASIWDDLWKTHDQQASKAFKEKNYKKAVRLFDDPQWHGASSYKSGDFNSAIQEFSKSKDFDSIYNKANSLAKAKQFQAAIDSYAQVIENAKDKQLIKDATFNKELVEKLLKQKKDKQKQDQKNKNQQDQQKKDQESKDQKNKDQKNSDQQSKEDSEKQKKQQQKNQEKNKSDQQSEQQKEQEAKIAEDKRDKNEKDQALEHWLEKIPDDPGGLLRRKMVREYQRRGGQQKEKKIW